MRYSYHGRIFQRIRAGELVGFHFEDHYPGIGEALVLEFSTLPRLRPIRPYKWLDYVRILDDWQAKKERPEAATSERPARGLASANNVTSIIAQLRGNASPNPAGQEVNLL